MKRDDQNDQDRYNLIPLNRNMDRERESLQVFNWPPNKHRGLNDLVISTSLVSKHSQLAQAWLIYCPEDKGLTIDEEVSTGGLLFRHSVRVKTSIRRY